MNEEKYRPFVVSAIIGCMLWTATGGLIHAYIVSPDWDEMGQRTFSLLLQWRPVVSLLLTGLLFGLGVEVAKFMGAIFLSQAAVLFLPIVSGVVIGGLQGEIISTDIWGFSREVVFRAESTRIFVGAA